jgi:hypothetical protein
MADGPDTNSSTREYTQLLRLHEQLLSQFVRSRDELLAPGTDRLVKRIKAQTGSEPDLTELKTVVEEAIRALKLSQSGIESAVMRADDVSVEVEGILNLPPYLQRFLAERAGGVRARFVSGPTPGWRTDRGQLLRDQSRSGLDVVECVILDGDTDGETRTY